MLVGCGKSESESEIEILREQTYPVENIVFDTETTFLDPYFKIIVETDQESLVVDLRDVHFVKTSEPSTTIHAKWTKSYREYIEATIYMSKSDFKEISMAYSQKHKATIPFKEGGKGERNHEN